MRDRLMEARALEKKTSKVSELKAHKQNEKQRESWRKIGIVNKKTRNAKVIKISVTKSRTLASGEVIPTVEECCTQESMEKAVMEENETRFTRCLSSIFFGACCCDS